MNIKIKK